MLHLEAARMRLEDGKGLYGKDVLVSPTDEGEELGSTKGSNGRILPGPI